MALLDNLGNVIMTTTTSGGGFYLFSNLPAGTYGLSFTLPAGYLWTMMNAGGNGFDTIDSDVNVGSGATAPLVLAAGETNLNVDAGLLEAPRLVASKSSVPGGGVVVRVDERITYTIWVTNVASTVALLVPVTDSIPAGTIYVAGSAVPPVDSGPNPLAWTLASMAPGVPFSVSFTVIVTEAPPGGSIRNVAFAGNNPVTETNEIIHVFAPTAIQLVSLSATRGLGADGESMVTVNWAVASESDTLGYRILRALTRDRDTASLVTDGVIAASGTGGSYAWVDAAAPAGSAFYWIQEVGLDGNMANEYGPVVAPPAGLPRAYLPVVQ